MTKKLGIHFGDIHFGAQDPQKTIDELNATVINMVDKLKNKVAYITINGDLFHKKLELDSKAALRAFKFIYELKEKCIKYNIKLRLIQGTATHDFGMLHIFDSLVDNNIFRIIYKVEIEQLFDNLKVLYIPEEYPSNINEYYKDYLVENSDIDLIFGHGTFKFQAHTSQIYESERVVGNAPIFDEVEFIEKHYFKGFCIFGHIHTHCNYKKKIYYAGSLSRTSHGEEKEKGILVSIYDTENQNYDIKFVANELASKYKSISYEADINIYEFNQIEEIIKKINKNFADYEYIRLVVNSEINKDITDTIRKYYADNRNFIFLLKFKVETDINNLLINDNSETTEQESNTLIEGLNIELSNSHYDNISTFIKEVYDYDINPQKVETMVNENDKI